MAKKKIKFELSKRYMIRFYDHCTGNGTEAIICRTYGWCVNVNKINVCISTWEVETDDVEVKRGNIEPINILLSAIVEVKDLK